MERPNRSKKARSLVRAAKRAQSAQAKRAEDLLALIARRKSRILDDFYDIGEALVELKKKKLFAALGFPSFEAMLDTRDVLGHTQAYKLIAVVTQLPRARAMELGQERAYALAALAAATPEHETAGELIETGLRVRGKTENVTKMSRRDLERAAREVRPRAKKDEARRAADAEARACEKKLRKKHIDAAVHVVRHEKTYWATVQLPLAALEALLGRGLR